jgi:hypothetical protein
MDRNGYDMSCAFKKVQELFFFVWKLPECNDCGHMLVVLWKWYMCWTVTWQSASRRRLLAGPKDHWWGTRVDRVRYDDCRIRISRTNISNLRASLTNNLPTCPESFRFHNNSTIRARIDALATNRRDLTRLADTIWNPIPYTAGHQVARLLSVVAGNIGDMVRIPRSSRTPCPWGNRLSRTDTRTSRCLLTS